MKKKIFLNMFFLVLCTLANAEVQVKIKDLAYIDGLKENQVFGYGLVVGLQGTGDSKSPLAESTLKNLLANLGLENTAKMNSKNTAAVLVTAYIPAYARLGDRFDVQVSSIGDAKSLEGGILIQSPLKGANGKTYLVAQGSVSLAGAAGSGRKSVKTVATISTGGLVENEIDPKLLEKKDLRLVLRNWDFTTAQNIIDVVSKKYPSAEPKIEDGGKIAFKIPSKMNLTSFMAELENLEVESDSLAKVIINEKTGTIVMGGDIRISNSLVSTSGLTVKVKGKEERGHTLNIKETTTVKDLVDTFNFAGVSTVDLIAILKGLKDAGALHAELVVK